MKRHLLLALLPLLLFLFACAGTQPHVNIPETATLVELSLPQCT